jgi:hypothetical protein
VIVEIEFLISYGAWGERTFKDEPFLGLAQVVCEKQVLPVFVWVRAEEGLREEGI